MTNDKIEKLYELIKGMNETQVEKNVFKGFFSIDNDTVPVSLHLGNNEDSESFCKITLSVGDDLFYYGGSNSIKKAVLSAFEDYLNQ